MDFNIGEKISILAFIGILMCLFIPQDDTEIHPQHSQAKAQTSL